MQRMNVALFFLVAVCVPGHQAFAATSCAVCHGDAETMAKLGFPQFFVTSLQVAQQTGMPAQCPDCHLGDPLNADKAGAHKGLLTMRAVTKKWSAPARSELPAQDLKDWPSIERRGKNRATQLGPKRMDGGELTDNPDYRTIIWHDKNPETLAFNPVLAEKTCGKCHPKHLHGFLQTSMGGAKGAHTQSQYVPWTSPAGPQSCGPWLGVMTLPEQEKFTDENITLYNGRSTAAMPQKVGHGIGDEFVILFVSNNFRMKGLVYLIKALAEIKKSDPISYKCLVLGRDRKAPYVRLAEKLGISQEVIFAGSTGEPEKYYGAADLLVHPTFYDACSLTVLESLASGLPVITTVLNGAAGTMADGQGGFVIQSPRDPQTLPEKIAFFFDERRRQESRVLARRCVERFPTELNDREMVSVLLKSVEDRRVSNGK